MSSLKSDLWALSNRIKSIGSFNIETMGYLFYNYRNRTLDENLPAKEVFMYSFFKHLLFIWTTAKLEGFCPRYKCKILKVGL